MFVNHIKHPQSIYTDHSICVHIILYLFLIIIFEMYLTYCKIVYIVLVSVRLYSCSTEVFFSGICKDFWFCYPNKVLLKVVLFPDLKFDNTVILNRFWINKTFTKTHVTTLKNVHFFILGALLRLSEKPERCHTSLSTEGIWQCYSVYDYKWWKLTCSIRFELKIHLIYQSAWFTAVKNCFSRSLQPEAQAAIRLRCGMHLC